MISVDRFGWSQLGNQLFQWAMLRAVSARHGFEMRLPINPGPSANWDSRDIVPSGWMQLAC
jgi:hypothetical protein